MPTLNLTEAQQAWLDRTYEIALDVSQSPDFALAFVAKVSTLTGFNPDHKSEQGNGIAQLVESGNPEEDLREAATRDFQTLQATGDIAQSLGTGISATPEQVQGTVQNILDTQAQVAEYIAPDDATFTELDSPGRRFSEAVASGNGQQRDAVVREMIQERVTERAGDATRV